MEYKEFITYGHFTKSKVDFTPEEIAEISYMAGRLLPDRVQEPLYVQGIFVDKKQRPHLVGFRRMEGIENKKFKGRFCIDLEDILDYVARK